MSDPLDDILLSPDLGTDERSVSLTHNPMVMLVLAANRVTRSSAGRYHDDFGVGAIEWRILVSLRMEPDLSVTRASEVIGIDKAAVSRSLARLEVLGFAAAVSEESDSRRRTWRLTPSGIALHERMLKVTIERQRRQLTGFTRSEIEQLGGLLRRLISNLDAEDARRA